MNITEMRNLLNVTRAEFSRLYSIPVRTLEDWESGRRKCPEYVLNLLERAVRADAAELSILDTTINRQIQAMDNAENESDIINNRFL